MALGRGRRGAAREEVNAWPGYVDALSTLLMVIIFVLLVFVLSQGFLSVSLSSRDQALDQLNRQASELAELLSLERGQVEELRGGLGQARNDARTATAARDLAARELAALRETMGRQATERDGLRGERDRLAARLSDTELAARGTAGRVAALEQRLTEALARGEASGSEAAGLTEQIRALAALRDRLERDAAQALARAGTAETATAAAEARAGEFGRLSESARAQAALLSRQLDELRAELRRVASALDAREAAGRDQDAQIAALGSRLNAALAARVEELQRYRSDFFGRLREVLGDRADVRIVGDRFVFQSEVLFPVGSAELSERGSGEIRDLARVLRDISGRIPAEVNWLLRVDGHADRSPIRGTGRFATNWELSSARAIAVAQLLIGEGLPRSRVAAAAFGENQPLDDRDTVEAFARNRRIELRLTDR